jgi:hypothetical protein
MGNQKEFMKNKLLRIMPYVLLTIVLYFIFNRFFATIVHNSDNASLYLEAKSVIDGNILLKGWTLPPDSFFTSDLLIAMLFVYIKGITPTLMNNVPAAIYAMLLISSILLVKQDKKVKEKYLNIIILLVLIGVPSEFYGEQIAMAPIHLTTILLLLITFLIIENIENNNNNNNIYAFKMLLIGITCFLAYTGDPFALYIGIIPIIIVALIDIYLKKNIKINFSLILSLCTAVAISGFVEKWIKFAGGFNSVSLTQMFVTIEKFSFNFRLTIQGILDLFGADFFGRKLIQISMFQLILHIIGIIFVIYCFIKLTKNSVDNNKIDNILLVAIIIDILAYLFSTNAVDIGSTRYLIPVIIYGSIIAGRFEIPTFYINKLVLVSVLIISLCNIIFFIPRAIAPVPNTPQIELSRWLNKHHLTYGYGSYWDSNIVTVSTNDEVKIRAVLWNGSKIVPYNWLSNKDWYLLDSHKQGGNFLVLSSNESNLTMNIAIKQFGNPIKTVNIGNNYTILEWDYDITDKLY